MDRRKATSNIKKPGKSSGRKKGKETRKESDFLCSERGAYKGDDTVLQAQKAPGSPD